MPEAIYILGVKSAEFKGGLKQATKVTSMLAIPLVPIHATSDGVPEKLIASLARPVKRFEIE